MNTKIINTLKKTGALFLLIPFVVLVGWQQDANEKSEEIKIESNFDRGSLGPVRIIDNKLVRGQTMHWIKKDMNGNQFYWFYFKISNVKDKKVDFEFTNMVGIYRGNPHNIMEGICKPVISYDNKTWGRIMDTRFDKESKTFYFSYQFEENEAWIAYAHPYPMERGYQLISDLKEKGVDIEKIGESPYGKKINLLTFPKNAKYSSDKKVILVLALQHASEDCGGYFTEGIIEALMENTDYSAEINKNYIYKIIPMMNPDGLLHGVSRYNFNMEDLNSEWDDDISDQKNLPVEPEVLAAKKWIKKWYDSGAKIDFAMDVHSKSQRRGDCAIHIRDKELDLLVEKINQYWPIRTAYKGPNPGKGNCLNFFTDELNTLAVTMELSQSHNGDGIFLTIEDYQLHGKYFVKAVDEFFKEKKK